MLNSGSTEILFVVGMARSGTTFVADLLNEGFDYGMGPEGSFVPLFARRLRRYGDLRRSANLKRLAKDVSQCEMLEIARRDYPLHERFDVTPEVLLARVKQPTYAAVVRAVFESVAHFQHKARLGSKYPSYWRHTELLEELFAFDARYLWIVRDGRDVALSLLQVPWGENSVYACARQWVRSMDRMAAFRQRVGEDRLLVVRYEDLLGSPAESLARIDGFAGTQLDQDRLEGISQRISRDPLATNFGKWKTRLSLDDLRLFEAVGARWLQRLGYECCYPDPRATWFECSKFLAEEYARRVRQLFV